MEHEFMKKGLAVRKRSPKNSTGISNKMKQQFKAYSSMSPDGVQVHCHSDRLRHMQALTCTQDEHKAVQPLSSIQPQIRLETMPRYNIPVTQLKKPAFTHNIIQMLSEKQADKVNRICFTDDFVNKHVGGAMSSKSDAKKKGEQKGRERNVANSSLIMLEKSDLNNLVLEKKTDDSAAHAQISQNYKSQIHFKMSLPCSNFSQGDVKGSLADNECVLVGQWNKGAVDINHYEGNMANFPPNDNNVLPIDEIAYFFENLPEVMSEFNNHYNRQRGNKPPANFYYYYLYYLHFMKSKRRYK